MILFLTSQSISTHHLFHSLTSNETVVEGRAVMIWSVMIEKRARKGGCVYKSRAPLHSRIHHLPTMRPNTKSILPYPPHTPWPRIYRDIFIYWKKVCNHYYYYLPAAKAGEAKMAGAKPAATEGKSNFMFVAALRLTALIAGWTSLADGTKAIALWYCWWWEMMKKGSEWITEGRGSKKMIFREDREEVFLKLTSFLLLLPYTVTI